MAGPTSEVVMVSVDGTRLRLCAFVPSAEDTDPVVSFTATLELAEARATMGVWDYGGALLAFFRDLAARLEPWEGDLAYECLEGQLALTCRHDGKGLVECEVQLGSQEPPPWHLKAPLTLGAGAHLEGIAQELEAFFGET